MDKLARFIGVLVSTSLLLQYVAPLLARPVQPSMVERTASTIESTTVDPLMLSQDSLFSSDALSIGVASQTTPAPVDIVFVMDTSGSMDDEFSVLCENIQSLVIELQNLGVATQYTILGIEETRQCASSTVPESVSNATVDDYEDWGPAVRDLSVGYVWQPGATRLIIPMSDEAPENGDSCSVPGADEDSITTAIAAAQANNVRVAPVLGSGHDECVAGLALGLAQSSGGKLFLSTEPASDLAAGILSLIGSVAADRDGDGIADDDDLYPDDACRPDPQAVCLPRQVCGFTNTPHWDDDADGRTDEELPDGVDDDGDNLVDEDIGGPNCPFPEQECRINSHRAFDDDGDGLTDEEADDSVDNDGDSYVDEDVDCACPAGQEIGVSDTPGVDDDLDFSVDEEEANGIDDDGDGCVDEDVAPLAGPAGPDLQIDMVQLHEQQPREMDKTTLTLAMSSSGGLSLPEASDVNVVVTVRDDDSGDFWRFPYEKTLSGSGPWEVDLEGHWFIYSRIDQLEVDVRAPAITEEYLANNHFEIPVEIIAEPTDWRPCIALLMDIVLIVIETAFPGVGHGVGIIIEAMAESAIRLLTQCMQGGQTTADEICLDSGVEVLVIYLAKVGQIAVDYAVFPSLTVFFSKIGPGSLVRLFFGVKHGIECFPELKNVIIRFIQDVRHQGGELNALLIESPLNALATNSQGQRVGILPDGTVLTEIPDSEVAVDEGAKLIVYPGTDTESVTVSGTGEGVFDLTLALSEAKSTEINAVIYEDVPVSASTIGEVDLEGGFELVLDDDGDGSVDRTVMPSAASGPGVASGGGSGGGLGPVAVILIVAIGGVFVYAAGRRRRAAPDATTVAIAPATLEFLAGPQSGQEIPVRDDHILGRGSAADVQLADTSVSRRHAQLRYAEGSWYIQDMGSTSGTFVNGQRIQATRLNYGDRVRLGKTEFVFRNDG